jgi:hypothetical protein
MSETNKNYSPERYFLGRIARVVVLIKNVRFYLLL